MHQSARRAALVSSHLISSARRAAAPLPPRHASRNQPPTSRSPHTHSSSVTSKASPFEASPFAAAPAAGLLSSLPSRRRCSEPFGSQQRMASSSSTVASEYSSLVESGAIQKDEGQERLAAALTDLQGQLSVWSGIRGALGFDASVAAWRISRVGGAGGRQGIYMSGGVGVGKSMMMDMLYESAATDLKRRAHFHSFMLDVHRRVHALRQVAGPGVDPIKSVARSIARNTVLLCFDEFQVTDVGDAMVLRRLMTVLLDHGVFLVITSNRRPDHLYQGGINRELFTPLIDLLKIKCNVMEIGGGKDYRSEHPEYVDGLWVVRSEEGGKDGRGGLERTFHELSGVPLTAAEPDEVQVVMGRSLKVRAAASGVAYVTFDDLCGSHKGSGDFLALAQQFHTVIMSDVPKLTLVQHDKTRRFVVLLDELYEHRCRFLASSSQPISSLFEMPDLVLPPAASSTEHSSMELRGRAVQQGKTQTITGKLLDGTREELYDRDAPLSDFGVNLTDLSAMKDLSFAFSRTVSRLREMGSWDYLEVCKTHPAAQSREDYKSIVSKVVDKDGQMGG